MTFIENLHNYTKRSLAHQLTRCIATQPCCADVVREIDYERTDRLTGNGHFPPRDTGIITFNTGLSIRIFDIDHPTYGYGLGVVDFDTIGELHNYGQRNYYRHVRRDLTDEQWRKYVAASIASDYEHIYALRNLATAERN